MTTDTINYHCPTHGVWNAVKESGCPNCIKEMRHELKTDRAKLALFDEMVEQHRDFNERLKKHIANELRLKRLNDELVEALENICRAWSDYTSQETYGEHLRAGLAKDDFSRWAEYHDMARAVLAKVKEIRSKSTVTSLTPSARRRGTRNCG